MMLCRRPGLGVTLAALAIVGIRPAAAAPPPTAIAYQIQPVLKLGDPIGNSGLSARQYLGIEALNDSDAILFYQAASSSNRLWQYANERYVPIAEGGGSAPGGQWPTHLDPSQGGMDQLGNVAFTAIDLSRPRWLGVYVSDAQKQQVIPVVSSGGAAGSKLVFGGFYVSSSPVINHQGEVAFAAPLQDSTGSAMGTGVFYQDQARNVVPIALPGDSLPGIGKISSADWPSLGSADTIAFRATSSGGASSAFVWKNGAITPVALAGQAAPGGGTFSGFLGPIGLNDASHTLLLVGVVGGSIGLYRVLDGQLTSVAVPGQAMPGGGVYVQLYGSPSGPNDAGQVAFSAGVKEGQASLAGAYLMDSKGQLSLIARDGSITPQGDLITLGPTGHTVGTAGVALNNKGHIALGMKIAGGPDLIALLTPTAQ